MTMDELKPGDLVVVVTGWASSRDPLNGRTLTLVRVRPHTLLPYRVRVPGRRADALVWVHEVRPATGEEQSAYWLEHGGAG